jgi:hypothetical protein
MENTMEKKFNLFGILGMVILVAVSTMGAVKYQRAPRLASGPAAPALACLPAASGSEFRSPHVWNGFLIPPVDVTSSLSDPVNACLPGDSAAASLAYQGIPVTGALPVFPQYQYRSANAAASASSVFPQYQYRSSNAAASASSVFPQYQYRSPNAAASALAVFQQYQYRSANSVASPVQVFKQYEYTSAGALPSPIWVFRQYEYRSFGTETGLAQHKMLYSGH